MAIPPDLQTPYTLSTVEQNPLLDPKLNLGENWIKLLPIATYPYIKDPSTGAQHLSYFEGIQTQREALFQLHLKHKSSVSHAFKKHVSKIAKEFFNSKSIILEVEAGHLLPSTKRSYLTSFLPIEIQENVTQSDRRIPLTQSSLPYLHLNFTSLTPKMLKNIKNREFDIVFSSSILETNLRADVLTIAKNIHKFLKEEGFFIQITDLIPTKISNTLFHYDHLQDDQIVPFPFLIQNKQISTLLCIPKKLLKSKFIDMNASQRTFLERYCNLSKLDKEVLLMELIDSPTQVELWNEVSTWITQNFEEGNSGYKKITYQSYLEEKIKHSLTSAGFNLQTYEERKITVQVKNHKDSTYNCVVSNGITIQKSLKKDIPEGCLEQTSSVRVIVAQKISPTEIKKES